MASPPVGVGLPIGGPCRLAVEDTAEKRRFRPNSRPHPPLGERALCCCSALQLHPVSIQGKHPVSIQARLPPRTAPLQGEPGVSRKASSHSTLVCLPFALHSLGCVQRGQDPTPE